jgi:hypothetical protein
VCRQSRQATPASEGQHLLFKPLQLHLNLLPFRAAQRGEQVRRRSRRLVCPPCPAASAADTHSAASAAAAASTAIAAGTGYAVAHTAPVGGCHRLLLHWLLLHGLLPPQSLWRAAEAAAEPEPCRCRQRLCRRCEAGGGGAPRRRLVLEPA